MQKTDHDVLTEIHTILASPGDCPPINEDDCLTVKRLKMLCRDHTRFKRVATARWDIGKRCLTVIGLTDEGVDILNPNKYKYDLYAFVDDYNDE